MSSKNQSLTHYNEEKMNLYLQLALTLTAGLASNVCRKHFTVKSTSGISGRALYSALTSIVAAIVLLLWGGFGSASGFTLWFGILFGAVTAIQTIANVSAINCGPMSYTAIFISFSVLISALSGVILFGEDRLEIIQIVGIVLMLVSIVLSANGNGDDKKVNLKWFILAFTAFLLTGAIGIMQKIHQTSDYKGELNAFLVIAFVASALISAGFALIKGRKQIHAATDKPQKSPIAVSLISIMMLAGLCVAANNKFNLFLSGALPTAIFFPVYNVGILLLTTLSAIVIFKERLSLKQWIGVAIGIISVICIRNPFA
jgi:drug/metabolite transporter (DMT)-like permease